MQTRWRMPPDNLAGIGAAEIAQAHEADRKIDPALDLGGIDTGTTQAKGNIVVDGEPGKLASSWNTTPTPSGTSPRTGLPSNSTVPADGTERPASTSSKVDLPQPDGPTTLKNSPARKSKEIRPSAWTSAWLARGG